MRKGVRVDGIAHRLVDTSLWIEGDALFARQENHLIGETKRPPRNAVPTGRIVLPDGPARTAVLLASDDAEYAVARTINMDGGNRMS